MTDSQPKNPLHGITLEKLVTRLFDHYGWERLAGKIDINCFKSDPSIKSSLKFLRRTPWARLKVESLYLSTFEAKSPWDKARQARVVREDGQQTSARGKNGV